MSTIVLVDGEPQMGSRIEVDCLSPGFAYGFGLFETAKFLKGNPVFFREHFNRLRMAGLEAGLEIGLSSDLCLSQLEELFRLNGMVEGIYKIYVFDDSGRARIVMSIRDRLPDSFPEPLRLRQSSVVKAAGAYTSRHKTMNYFENWRELRESNRHGFDDCIFGNEAGFLTECSMRNIFFMADGILKTPSLECGLLNGVIRDAVLRIAAEDGLAVDEGAFRMEELKAADGVFVTSSGSGVVPVREIQCENFHWEVEETIGAIGLLRDRLIQLELEDVEGLF